MHDDAPLDPFADDPEDPAAALGDLDDEVAPLSMTEREDVLADLSDLEVFRALLEPLGIKGLTVDCTDCGKPHHIDWELLYGNLRHLLDQGMARVHEPAIAAEPTDYVSWEYARGYVDGVIDSEEGHSS
ncbi:hypothetical protein FB559_3775 [Actinoallomurus bryophytorum]|uniref:DUF5319 domain-containing protein n=1 Tax=Actinoallomurus bryophytorum TaxID=1490222 RepID=A0A543CM25_9ACTN|nr:DUF5319 domain-containing protein [Actinoallomurus bryophytorum]TQL98156.1 hypothetical protein FB559_3775 [Actinoallomurus bryophytorum]